MKSKSVCLLGLMLLVISIPSSAEEKQDLTALRLEYHNNPTPENVKILTEEFLEAWRQAYDSDPKEKNFAKLYSFYNETYEYTHTRYRLTTTATNKDYLKTSGDDTSWPAYADLRNGTVEVLEEMYTPNAAILKVRVSFQKRTEINYWIDRGPYERVWVLIFERGIRPEESGLIRHEMEIDYN